MQWLGDLLGIAAAVLWGATTLAIRATRLATVAPEKTLAYQLAVSGLTLVALALLSGERWPDGLETLPMAALAYQVIVIAFATYLAWFWLIAHYPATRLASFTLLTPVAGLLFGVLLLDEALTPQLLLALAGAFWLVRSLTMQKPPSRTGPAIRSREPDQSPQDDGGGGH